MAADDAIQLPVADADFVLHNFGAFANVPAVWNQASACVFTTAFVMFFATLT